MSRAFITRNDNDTNSFKYSNIFVMNVKSIIINITYLEKEGR